MKVVFCMCAPTSSELKINIEAARLTCPETKDELHFLPSSVPIAKFDPVDQCASAVVCLLELKCSVKGKGLSLAKSLKTTTSYLW